MTTPTQKSDEPFLLVLALVFACVGCARSFAPGYTFDEYVAELAEAIDAADEADWTFLGCDNYGNKAYIYIDELGKGDTTLVMLVDMKDGIVECVYSEASSFEGEDEMMVWYRRK